MKVLDLFASLHQVALWAPARIPRPLTTSVAIAEIREPPHVPQPHTVAQAGEQEFVLPAPRLPRLGGLRGWGRPPRRERRLRLG